MSNFTNKPGKRSAYIVYPHIGIVNPLTGLTDGLLSSANDEKIISQIVHFEIENINHHPIKLKAIDFQDGSEGIYVENNFRAEATREVLDDVIGDINIPSVPQVGGLTQVFRRSNRKVKVTVLNNYRLILKPKL